MNMNKNIVGFLTILIMAGIVVADYVQTPIYFSVPTQIAFTVFTISNSQTSQTSGTAPYPLTELYYFNSTNGYTELKTVCITGDNSNCQSGPGKPAFRYRNTGTVNISIFQMYNATLPTGVLSCVNSTKPTGCGGTTIATCNMGNLNSTIWATIGTQLSAETPCFEKNATIYANFSAVVGGTYVVGLTHNSTAS
jgi:hypothetical protein